MWHPQEIVIQAPPTSLGGLKAVISPLASLVSWFRNEHRADDSDSSLMTKWVSNHTPLLPCETCAPSLSQHHSGGPWVTRVREGEEGVWMEGGLKGCLLQ